MTFHKMGIRLIHKDQRGITLIEMLIAVALVGLITGGITMTINQVLTINTRASSHMVALRQVQQAGKEVSKDALQAQHVDDNPSGGQFLFLCWTDWDGTKNEVTYTITADDKLRRELEITPADPEEEPTTIVSIVAEYIDVTFDLLTGKAKTYCDWDPVAKVLTFQVTATVGIRSETRVYEIEPRPAQQ
jgi:prepilin-type N-terminal cleavage/methylation domain-containing protein